MRLASFDTSGPFADTFVKASLSVMSAAAELFGQKRCGELLKGLGDGAGLLLSIIVSAGVLFLVTFAILFLGGKQLWEA